MELSEIKREKDLRKITFADLFYEIYDEPNGEEIALGIIRAIMPDFDETYREGRIEAAKYERFRKYLIDAHTKRTIYSRMGSNIYSSLMFSDQWINDHVMGVYGGSVEKFLDQGSFETVCKALYKEFTEVQNPVEGEKKRHYLIDTLVKNDTRYDEFYENLCKKINDLATNVLGSSKIIKGLYLLPRLNSDQELIIFFGNNFHVTLNAVDAYTGLLYASEYFDFDGEILASLTTRFTDDEMKAAEESETDNLAKEREEETRREEERQRSEKYNNAVKSYENGNYEAAYKAFCELGDYREAKTKAEEAKLKRDEKARIDNMRSEASRLMKPIEVAEKYGSKTHRVSWKVLDIDPEAGKVLMTTTESVGERPWGWGTWSECSLRKWLNGEFYSSLPEEARIRIATTKVQDYDAGDDVFVEDKIFVLSVREVYKYFTDHRSRQFRNPGEKNASCWWMRNLSTSGKRGVRVVDKDGDGDRYQVTVTDMRRGWRQYDEWEEAPSREGGSSYAVRPALWIDTNLDESSIKTRQADEKLVSSYRQATESMYDGDYRGAEAEFRKLGDYKDSKKLAELCSKGIYYAEAKQLMAEARTEKDYLAAIAKFEKAGDFRLSREGSYSGHDARSSKASCEKLAKKAKLTEGLAALSSSKPKKEDGPTPLEREVERLKTEKSGHERTLSNLGLFHGSEKQQLREKIAGLESKIAQTSTRAAEQRKDHDAKYRKEQQAYETKARAFAGEVSVGDELFFGGADRKGYNGKPNPWGWRVVSKSGGELVMISFAAQMPYHETMEKTDWKNCSLRKSLQKLYDRDFTAKEKLMLKKVLHGNAEDYLYIPSSKEFEQYGISLQGSGGVWARSNVDDRGEAELAGTWRSRIECTKKQSTRVMITVKLY